MPYIKEQRRNALMIGDALPETEGELNFVITQFIKLYLGPKPNYAKYNSVVGVLGCVTLELYRRKVVPYETEKMLENGDVY
jgi:hypothetical protein